VRELRKIFCLLIITSFILSSCGTNLQPSTTTISTNVISGNITGYVVKKDTNKTLIVSSSKNNSNHFPYDAVWVSGDESLSNLSIGEKVEINLLGTQAASYPGLTLGKMVKILDQGVYDGANMKVADVIRTSIEKHPMYAVPNPRNIAFDNQKRFWTIKLFDESNGDNVNEIIDDSQMK
jgi:hypothetical protein